MGIFEKLAGTVSTFFQIGGPTSSGINNNSNVLEARNAANSAFVIVRGDDPVNANDLTTKQYVDGLVGGGVKLIRFAITTSASQTSTTSIPANAIILRASLDIQTAYDNNATITVGRTGSASLMMASSDSFVTTQNMFQVDQDTDFGGSALPVLVTVTGTPTVGAGFCLVEYATPLT